MHPSNQAEKLLQPSCRQFIVQPLSMGEMLDYTVYLMKDNFKVVTMMVLFVSAPINIAWDLAQEMFFPEYASVVEAVFNPEQNGVPAILDVLVLLISVGVVGAIDGAAMLHVFSKQFISGERSTFKESLRFSLRFLPRMGFLNLQLVFLIMVGMFLCILPGILAVACFFVADAALVFENRGVYSSCGRSHSLVRSRLGTSILFVLVIVSAIVVAPSPFALIPVPYVAAVIANIVTEYVGCASTALTVLFYYSLRCEQEQFDLDWHVQRVEALSREQAKVL